MQRGYLKFVEVVDELVQELEETQGENMVNAGKLMADAIMSGGIIQAFGSGHSYAAAMEVATRAGGLIPTKAIIDPAAGMYEMVEGVGEQLVKQIDVRENDVVFIISNSGRNPLGIELAAFVKKQGAKLIVVTSLESSQAMSSRHSSGKKLYEFADVVLDNRVAYGDASVEVEGIDTKLCGTSSIAASFLIQGSVVEAIETMVKKGYHPPVYMSMNVDGGREFNNKIMDEYADRIYRK